MTKTKRYHGFIIEHRPGERSPEGWPLDDWLVTPYTRKTIGGPRYFYHGNAARFYNRELAVAWGGTWKVQGL